MKRKLLSVLFCFSFTALMGCEKTPEETIVREKGAQSTNQYESGEETNSPLRKRLEAPKHYENESVYADGKLVIHTDADIMIPNADTVNTYAVSAKEVNQDMIDKVTKAFFEGDKIYHGYQYSIRTKDDIQQQITTLKKYKSEGNLDPYEYGTDENGAPQFDLDATIARYEEELKTAPEEIEKQEVTPAFNLEYWSKKGDEQVKEKDLDHFMGVAETKNGAFQYRISYLLKPNVEFTITKNRDDLPDKMEFSAWTEGQFVLSNPESENYIEEEYIKEKIGISYEEAEKIAKEKVEKLGFDLSAVDWDYGVFCYGEQGVKKDKMLDAGYLFHFSRKLDDIPITYTLSYGGALEDMDSTLKPWGYEYCDIIIGDDGVQEAKMGNFYDVGGISTENVKLMDFESIIKIYEQMMEVSNLDVANYEAGRTYNIRKIVFGYTRIYDPAADNDTGLLVPVWDFFGGFDSKSLDGEVVERNSGERSAQSFMTINAIDGTIIDRELGY